MTEHSSASAGSAAPGGNSGDALARRVALVTGASRGIGRAIATRLVEDGATVVYGYNEDRASAIEAVEAARARGGHAKAVALDVTSPAQVASVVSEVSAGYGRLDILVNSAGIMRRAPFLDIALGDWDDTVRTNLTGYFLVSQAVGRVMAEQGAGAIVHISSTNEQTASVNCSAYAAAKGGVRMLTRQMALELGPLGIRTNAVAPGMVETDLNRTELTDQEFCDAALSRIPLGHFATPVHVAEAVSYLVSDRSGCVNGTTLVVDGGKLAA